MSEVPAGWYPSPEIEGQLQYWDGQGWTNYRAVASAEEPAAQQPVQPVAQVPQPVQPAAQAAQTAQQGAVDQTATYAVNPQAAVAGAAAAGAVAAAGSPQTVVPAEAPATTGKKRFGLGRAVQTPGAVVASSQEEADKALKRARLISFATGLVLFIFGLVIGAIVF